LLEDVVPYVEELLDDDVEIEEVNLIRRI